MDCIHYLLYVQTCTNVATYCIIWDWPFLSLAEGFTALVVFLVRPQRGDHVPVEVRCSLYDDARAQNAAASQSQSDTQPV